MIARTKIKVGGVNTSDAAIIVYKNTKEEFPLVGQEKILYLVIPTSELYIWTGQAYCKINGVLEETLSSLAERFKNYSELTNSKFAALAAQIEKVDKETKQEFIDTYAQIEIAASTQEELKRELNETLNILSNDIETYIAESQKELGDLSQALDTAQSDLSTLNQNMTSFMDDGVFTTAEIVAIGQLYNQINQSFSSLAKEYTEVVDKIESIIESSNPKDVTDFINDEFPSLNNMKSIWEDPNKEVFVNDSNIPQLVLDIHVLNKSLEDFNLQSLFRFVLELCLYISKDKKATNDERSVWQESNTYLSSQLTEFESSLRATTAAIALFDASDEIQEAVAGINSTMNGLQDQIDGQIINWNDEGLPLPLYDHNTKKWHNGTNWVDQKQTTHQGPSSEWEGKYDQHINDTYVDLTTGGAYRWCNTDVGYHWCKITDTATEEVLRKASELEGALDGKTTTFLQQEPIPPYHIGDLWIVHKDYEEYKKGEALNCIRDKKSGKFDISDWSRELIYQEEIDNQKEQIEELENIRYGGLNLLPPIALNNRQEGYFADTDRVDESQTLFDQPVYKAQKIDPGQPPICAPYTTYPRNLLWISGKAGTQYVASVYIKHENMSPLEKDFGSIKFYQSQSGETPGQILSEFKQIEKCDNWTQIYTTFTLDKDITVDDKIGIYVYAHALPNNNTDYFYASCLKLQEGNRPTPGYECTKYEAQTTLDKINLLNDDGVFQYSEKLIIRKEFEEISGKTVTSSSTSNPSLPNYDNAIGIQATGSLRKTIQSIPSDSNISTDNIKKAYTQLQYYLYQWKLYQNMSEKWGPIDINNYNKPDSGISVPEGVIKVNEGEKFSRSLLSQYFTQYYQAEQDIITQVQNQYSDQSIDDNNKKQLINVNNLIAQDRYCVMNLGSQSLSYSPLATTKLLDTNKQYVLGFKSSSNFNIDQSQYFLYLMNLDLSAGNLWNVVAGAYSYNGTGIEIINDEVKDLGNNVYEHKITFKGNVSGNTKFNSIGVVRNGFALSTYDYYLYTSDVENPAFKPGIPDIDIQALWYNLNKINEKLGSDKITLKNISKIF